jgi:hypothetical protein
MNIYIYMITIYSSWSKNGRFSGVLLEPHVWAITYLLVPAHNLHNLDLWVFHRHVFQQSFLVDESALPSKRIHYQEFCDFVMRDQKL